MAVIPIIIIKAKRKFFIVLKLEWFIVVEFHPICSSKVKHYFQPGLSFLFPIL